MAKRITTIPAKLNKFTSAPIAEIRKRRVAAYARVSTQNEDQASSFAAQTDYYTNFIQNRDDWEFAGICADDGVSGCNTKKRKGFTQMVEDALAGKIDLIVTKSVSRFARNTVDSLNTIRELKEHGVEVFFEEQGIYTFDSKGELLLTIMSSIAQEESRNISENVTWGQRKRYSDGKHSLAYSRFCGYDRGPDGKMVINEEQAVTVRRIFRLFLEGKTPIGIAKILTEDGVPTPGGAKKWSSQTVRRMLSNEKYRGDALLQKVFTVDFLSKKTKINEGEVPQYYIEDDHEAIIEPAVFEEVQRELARRANDANAHSGVNIFSSHIKCGDCGGWYGPKTWHSTDKYRRTVWRCNHKYNGEHKCQTPHLDEETIKAAFISAVNKLFEEKGLIDAEKGCSQKETVITDYRELMPELYDTTALEQEKCELEDRIVYLADTLERIISENAHTAIDQEEYRKHFNSLSTQYDHAEERLNAVKEKIRDIEIRKSAMENFLKTLEEQDGILTEFHEQTWYSLVDFMTVYSKDDIRITFKDGTEIKA
ncbi:MAG: recombinase family protein [Clostridiales bacterium]|nr:recombinase family protein [Clostridiales bacterium]